MNTITVLVPAFNEEKNIPLLHSRIKDVMKKTGISSWYILFVDDGSTDETYNKMLELRKKNRNVQIIKFYSNYGKSAALDAGFKHSDSDIIITMDADLQDEPKEIPRFIDKLNKGYDMVSGWKYNRKDSLSKRIPSKIFNFLASVLTGVKIHDFNCGFKAYKKIVTRHLKLYGEMHRYVPVMAAGMGFKVGEIKVNHNKRKHGVSKYGFSRLFKGTFDLITTTFFMKYSKSPLHLFGSLGMISFFLGFLGGLYIIWLKLQGISVGERPLLYLVLLLVIVGIQFISLGLLAEMITRDREEEFYIIDEKRE